MKTLELTPALKQYIVLPDNKLRQELFNLDALSKIDQQTTFEFSISLTCATVHSVTAVALKWFNSINTTIKINLHNKRSNSYFRIFTLQSPLCYPHHSGPKGLIQQTLYFLSSNKSPLYHHAPLEIHSIKQPLFTDAVSHSQHSNPHCNSMWRLLQFDYFLKFDTTRTPLVRATLFSSAFPIIPTHLIISCVLDNYFNCRHSTVSRLLCW